MTRPTYDHLRNRTAPMRDRLISIMQKQPTREWLTYELAELMGKSTATMSAMLCRLHLYGIVRKVAEHTRGVRRPQEFNRWKLK